MEVVDTEERKGCCGCAADCDEGWTKSCATVGCVLGIAVAELQAAVVDLRAAVAGLQTVVAVLQDAVAGLQIVVVCSAHHPTQVH